MMPLGGIFFIIITGYHYAENTQVYLSQFDNLALAADDLIQSPPTVNNWMSEMF